MAAIRIVLRVTALVLLVPLSLAAQAAPAAPARRDLPAPNAEIEEPFTLVMALRELANGRVAVVDGRKLEEFDVEVASRRPLKGNIYLAKVTRVEPSLQAAFVEYGGNRHGFLAFSEIHPDYYRIPIADREALLRAAAEEMDDDGDDFDHHHHDDHDHDHHHHDDHNHHHHGDDDESHHDGNAEEEAPAGSSFDHR